MKKFNINGVEVTPSLKLYAVHDFMGAEHPALAITLSCDDGEPFADVTVSFGEFIGMKNAAYIDLNNLPGATVLLAEGVAQDTGIFKCSGFCKYPLWLFDEEFLKGIGKESYAIYSEDYDEYMRADEENGDGTENV